MYEPDLEKAEEPEINLPTYTGSQKKQGDFRKGVEISRNLAMPTLGRYGQIHIHWIIEKAREFQKNIYFCFIDYTKAFDCVDHDKLENC